jgi:hypothetical protein
MRERGDLLLIASALVVAVVVVVIALIIVSVAFGRGEALITIRAVNYSVANDDPDPGGETRFTSLLYNYRRSFNAIGNATLICTFMGKGGPLGSGTSECMGTFNLPKGKIVVGGSRKSRAYYVLAITGGTGLYTGARGQLIAATRGLPEGQQRLVFSLE